MKLNLTPWGLGLGMLVGVAMIVVGHAAPAAARDAGAPHVPITSRNWTSLDGGQLYFTTPRTAGAYLMKSSAWEIAYVIVHSDGRRIQLTTDELFDLVETLQSLKKGPGPAQ